MEYTRKLLKYAFLGAGTTAVVGGAVSLRSNQFNLDSIGIVRVGRATVTVSKCFTLRWVILQKRALLGAVFNHRKPTIVRRLGRNLNCSNDCLKWTPVGVVFNPRKSSAKMDWERLRLRENFEFLGQLLKITFQKSTLKGRQGSFAALGARVFKTYISSAVYEGTKEKIRVSKKN